MEANVPKTEVMLTLKVKDGGSAELVENPTGYVLMVDGKPDKRFKPKTWDKRQEALIYFSQLAARVATQYNDTRSPDKSESFVWRKIKLETRNPYCYDGFIILDTSLVIRISVYDRQKGSSNKPPEPERYEANCGVHSGKQYTCTPISGFGPTREKALTAMLTEVRRMVKVRQGHLDETTLLEKTITDNTAGIRHGGLNLDVEPKKKRGRKK